jgi:hypothetical protein
MTFGKTKQNQCRGWKMNVDIHPAATPAQTFPEINSVKIAKDGFAGRLQAQRVFSLTFILVY